MTVAALSLSVGSAGAAAGYRLTVTPKRISPGGTVTLTTTPRVRCSVRVTVNGKHFTHAMPYGWMRVKMPRADGAGRIALRVTCDRQVVDSAFTVAKKK